MIIYGPAYKFHNPDCECNGCFMDGQNPVLQQEEAFLQSEVDAALERVREDRDAKIQKEIDECPDCQ